MGGRRPCCLGRFEITAGAPIATVSDASVVCASDALRENRITTLSDRCVAGPSCSISADRLDVCTASAHALVWDRSPRPEQSSPAAGAGRCEPARCRRAAYRTTTSMPGGTSRNWARRPSARSDSTPFPSRRPSSWSSMPSGSRGATSTRPAGTSGRIPSNCSVR
jgi:hypothetical protein